MLIKLVKDIDKNEYPYSTIAFKSLDLNAPVVFFTGENGSGKSTILRIISQLTNSINVSKNIDYRFEKYKGFSVSWNTKLKRGYYFQSEDFYTFLSWIEKEEQENKDLLNQSIKKHGNRESFGKILEIGLHEGNVEKMKSMVSKFKMASHGEGYISFFSSKLRGKTLYLLDEPETPLSFQNQLTLISLIKKYVDEGSQFIICTHSPILLAYPNALIYHFSDKISITEYENHPIVRDYTSFLSSPTRYMKYLFDEEE
ncbi:AAA family ATPase [Haploplasma axanthum]|nr:AAA family ATPase [Haploplasma axanthum]